MDLSAETLHFLDLIDYFLSHVGKFSTIISSKYSSMPFFFPLLLWDPYNSNISAFTIVPVISEAILNSFHSFPLFCSSAVISTILSSSSPICSA